MANLHFRTKFKMEQAARLEAMGIPDPQIATHLNLSPAGLATLKQRAEYAQIRLTVTSGVLSALDSAVVDDFKAVKMRLKQAIPEALNTIIDAMHDRTNKKLAIQAAETLLDREGTFTKVSRTGAPTPDQNKSFLTPKDNSIAESLANAMTPVAPLTDKIM